MNLFDELPDAIQEGLLDVEDEDILLLAGCQGMDFGAKLALEQLKGLRPELDDEKLLHPLKKRVAGNV